LQRQFPLAGAEAFLLQEVCKGLNAVSVKTRDGVGKLIGMTAAFDGQGFFNESDGISITNAQPEIIVFTNWKRLIKEPHLREYFPMDDHGRWAYETTFQELRKAMTSRLFMIFFWIQLMTVSNPDFFRLTDSEFTVFSEELELHPELSWEPKIIGIQERQPFPGGCPDSGVPRSTHSPMRLQNKVNG
jgi:hypothetical protein